jgi:hypothetical protein
MHALLIAAAAGIVLSISGCAKLETVLQRNLPQICREAQADHDAFASIAATGLVAPATVAREGAVYDGIVTICADPDHTSVVDAVTRVADAYQAIKDELKAARAAN